MNTPGFIHRFLPAPVPTGAPTLLLLHGTGGNESDLLEIGRSIAPAANLLSPRGNVLENGMPRFFRRLAEGVFDEEDLVRRTHELADFVTEASETYGFDAGNVFAAGYSNGANIAACLLLLRPGVLRRAVLLRAMVPLVPGVLPDLDGSQVLLASGVSDPLVPLANARRLASMFRSAGAAVEHLELPGGHPLTASDIDAARGWLS